MSLSYEPRTRRPVKYVLRTGRPLGGLCKMPRRVPGRLIMGWKTGGWTSRCVCSGAGLAARPLPSTPSGMGRRRDEPSCPFRPTGLYSRARSSTIYGRNIRAHPIQKDGLSFIQEQLFARIRDIIKGNNLPIRTSVLARSGTAGAARRGGKISFYATFKKLFTARKLQLQSFQKKNSIRFRLDSKAARLLERRSVLKNKPAISEDRLRQEALAPILISFENFRRRFGLCTPRLHFPGVISRPSPGIPLKVRHWLTIAEDSNSYRTSQQPGTSYCK